MCDIVHEITIHNLKSNELIEYRILLIKGVVKHVCPDKKLEINHNGKSVEYNSLLKKNELKFILTIDLNTFGVHEISVQFCNAKLELRLNRSNSVNPFNLVPFYVIVKGDDGRFQSDGNNKDGDNTVEVACEKLQLGLELIQSLYAEKINESTFGRKTFNVKKKCSPFYSNLTLQEANVWDAEKVWNFLARELLSLENCDPTTEKYIAFLGCTSYVGYPGIPYNYREIFKQVKCNPAISVGGLALLGTGCLYTWASEFSTIFACVTNQQIVDIEKNLDDSNYRRTYGGCYATTLGSVCHEIGHLFDLGHTNDGMMGNDIDFINRVFTLDHKTEILPTRIVCGIKKNSSRVTETKPNPRLTKIVRPGIYLDKYHAQKSNDLSYFTMNCLVTLSNHKWLNDGCITNDGGIYFDRDNNKVVSKKYSIQLVEIREIENEMLVKYWTFLDATIFEFVIPSDVMLMNCLIFGINKNGDIMKVPSSTQ